MTRRKAETEATGATLNILCRATRLGQKNVSVAAVTGIQPMVAVDVRACVHERREKRGGVVGGTLSSGSSSTARRAAWDARDPNT